MFCAANPHNQHYGDDLRSTLQPTYCNCKSPECHINVLVDQYKSVLDQFTHIYPNYLGYTMCL